MIGVPGLARKFGLEQHQVKRRLFLISAVLVVLRVIQQGLQAARVAQAR
jgi:hypothetical protein